MRFNMIRANFKFFRKFIFFIKLKSRNLDAKKIITINFM